MSIASDWAATFEPPAGPGDQPPTTIEPGTRVKAGDRGNFGTVVEDHGDACVVRFVNPSDGNTATKLLPKAELTLLDGTPCDGRKIEVPPTESLRDLIANHKHLKPPIIHGLLRRGETMNVIAAPKAGKSWLGYGLALSVASGWDWLDTFACEPGRVLVIDAELHRETIAHRFPLVRESMGLDESVIDRIDVRALRGLGVDLTQLGPHLADIEPGTYSLIILDAWYRFLPPGVSENDNAAVMTLFNLIDNYANQLDACWVNIHHASKGDQSQKGTTDVGSGAGSQSRAADSHMIIRPHESDGVAVIEAVVRSWAPVEPLAIRYEFPVWRPAPDADPRRLHNPRTRQAAETKDADRQEIVNIIYRQTDPSTKTFLRESVTFGKDRFGRAFTSLVDDGTIASQEIKGARNQSYTGWTLSEEGEI